MKSLDDPFRVGERLVAELRRTTACILVDMHCEATSEKNAMGAWLDGKVSAVVGTHTHVQTADERILPGAPPSSPMSGMCGPLDSVIGIKKEQSIERFLTQRPNQYEVAKNLVYLQGVVVDIDDGTGKGPEHHPGAGAPSRDVTPPPRPGRWSGMSLLRRATPDEQFAEVTRATVDLQVADELRSKLRRSYEREQPLIVKAGFDPNRPDLHLGHTLLLTRMRRFQDFGHEVVFLIGDFTAMIGDPSGKNVTRPALSREEVLANAETYKTQVFKVLGPAADEDPVQLRVARRARDRGDGPARRALAAGADAGARRLQDPVPRGPEHLDARAALPTVPGVRLGRAQGGRGARAAPTSSSTCSWAGR
jgi:hypothetical protein